MNEERKNHLHKQTVAEHAFFWPVRTIQETLSAQRVISHLKKKKPKTQHSCGLLAFKQLVRATGLESSQQKLTAQKKAVFEVF
ncbi:MAG: hypothetical protein ACLTEF_14125 [[Clostridium] leptum]